MILSPPMLLITGTAPPEYVDKGAFNRVTNASIDIDYPATTVSGQFAVLVVLASHDISAINMAGDWVAVVSDFSSSLGAKIFVKPCDGTEGDTSELFDTEGAATRLAGQIFTFSGCDVSDIQDGPIVSAMESYDSVAGTGDTMTSNSTITTDANRLGVRIYCMYDGLADDLTTSAVPSGWTQREEVDADAGGFHAYGIALDTKIISAAGTEGASTRTLNDDADKFIVFDFALIPA